MQTKSKLKALNVRPSKGRGQNFLTDQGAILDILAFSKFDQADNLLEIGPGLGALTEALVNSKKSLTLIELETSFAEELKIRYPAVRVINEDICNVDLTVLVQQQKGTKLTIFGNLPYSRSTDITLHLIEHRLAILEATLMFQREFAQRMAAKPGGREYGALSVAVQLHCDIELGPLIPASAFHPKPDVESRVIKLKFLETPRVELSDPKLFRKVVKAAFQQRRKQVHNSLKNSNQFVGIDISQALNQANIDPMRRAETISVAEYAALANFMAIQKS